MIATPLEIHVMLSQISFGPKEYRSPPAATMKKELITESLLCWVPDTSGPVLRIATDLEVHGQNEIDVHAPAALVAGRNRQRLTASTAAWSRPIGRPLSTRTFSTWPVRLMIASTMTIPCTRARRAVSV